MKKEKKKTKQYVVVVGAVDGSLRGDGCGATGAGGQDYNRQKRRLRRTHVVAVAPRAVRERCASCRIPRRGAHGCNNTITQVLVGACDCACATTAC